MCRHLFDFKNTHILYLNKNKLKPKRSKTLFLYISKSRTVDLPFQLPLHSCMHNNKNNLLQRNHQNPK